MRSFFRQVFASFVGMMLFTSFVFFLFYLFIVAMSAVLVSSMSNEPQQFSHNDQIVLLLNPRYAISDYNQEDINVLQVLRDKEIKHKLGLNDILEKIKRAASDPQVEGIVLNMPSVAAGWATIEEIRNALIAFKESEKFIYSYAGSYSQRAFYLASVADSIMMNPSGLLELKGLGINASFYKGLMDKIGVKATVIRGTNNKFKSAYESFTRTDMSEESRAEYQQLTNALWRNITADIAENRSTTIPQLNRYADNLSTFSDAPQWIDKGLIDKVGYTSDVDDLLEETIGYECEKVSFEEYNPVDMSIGYGDVAVVVAEGTIISTTETGVRNREGYVVDTRTIKALKDAAKHADAIVFRVNSPGGSSYASEQIWQTLNTIKEDIPVVVSMGNVAASGGYYIACPAHKIYADKNTITGSIGIIGMFLNAQELLEENIGITSDRVMTHKYTDLGNFGRPLSSFELAKMQHFIDLGYNKFKLRVAEGREMSEEQVEALAKGRVWSAANAVALGLVDSIGGLEAAIAEAERLADIENATVTYFPEKESEFSQIFSMTGGILYNILGMETQKTFSKLEELQLLNGFQAKMPDIRVE